LKIHETPSTLRALSQDPSSPYYLLLTIFSFGAFSLEPRNRKVYNLWLLDWNEFAAVRVSAILAMFHVMETTTGKRGDDIDILSLGPI
jgi:hypothetical protein